MKVAWTVLFMLLAAAAPAFAGTAWQVSTWDQHVIPLDVTRTATGYRGVLRTRSDVWQRKWTAMGCPGDGMLEAGTTVLELVRQNDGTFEVTFYSRLYTVGADGVGSSPPSGCAFQAVHHTARFVDRATAAHQDPRQVDLFPANHDSFLVMGLSHEPCLVPEDAKVTCGVVFPYPAIFDAPLPDTDADGLPDEWELGGLRVGGQLLDLHAMGADPDHKDLFIQIDATQSTALSSRVLAAAAAQLGRLPIWNPDGRPGITLHADAGAGSIMDPRTGRTWGALSRADSALALLPENFSSFPSGQLCPDNENIEAAPFVALRARRMDPLRGRAFRYAAVVKYLGPSKDCYSGEAFGILTPGFVIADWASGSPFSDEERLGTFLHELGHSVGLRHGGAEDTNWKPNYQSVMNYAYQFTGIPGAATGRWTWSVAAPSSSNAIDEAHLDESVGLPDVVPAGTKLAYKCPHADEVRLTAARRAVDLDCDNHTTRGQRFIDLSPDDSADPLVLRTFDDISLVQLKVPAEASSARAAGRETIRMSQVHRMLAVATGDRHPPTVRLSLRTRPGGRVALITAHDDVGLAAAVVTVGAHTQVLMISPPDAPLRDSTQSVDIDATGPVTVVISDLVGQTATATAP